MTKKIKFGIDRLPEVRAADFHIAVQRRIAGSVWVLGAVNVVGHHVHVDGDLTIQGSADFYDGVTVHGDIHIHGTAFFGAIKPEDKNSVKISGKCTVEGDLFVGRDLYVGRCLRVGGELTNKRMTVTNIDVFDSIDVGGRIDCEHVDISAQKYLWYGNLTPPLYKTLSCKAALPNSAAHAYFRKRCGHDSWYMGADSEAHWYLENAERFLKKRKDWAPVEKWMLQYNAKKAKHG